MRWPGPALRCRKRRFICVGRIQAAPRAQVARRRRATSSRVHLVNRPFSTDNGGKVLRGGGDVSSERDEETRGELREGERRERKRDATRPRSRRNAGGERSPLSLAGGYRGGSRSGRSRRSPTRPLSAVICHGDVCKHAQARGLVSGVGATREK